MPPGEENKPIDSQGALNKILLDPPFRRVERGLRNPDRSEAKVTVNRDDPDVLAVMATIEEARVRLAKSKALLESAAMTAGTTRVSIQRSKALLASVSAHGRLALTPPPENVINWGLSR
jgi:hypothetical protein